MAKFKEEEQELLIYYNKNKILNKLNTQLKEIRKAIDNIREELRNLSYIDISENLGAQQYAERVQSSIVGSYVDNTIDRQTDYKIREKEQKEQEEIDLLEEIGRIKNIIRIKEWEIESLNNEDKKFIEKRYKKHMSQQALALDMYLDQANISRRQQKILGRMKEIKLWDFIK